MKSIRKITMIAAAGVALNMGAAFGNTNTPTVQPQCERKASLTLNGI